VRDLDPENDLRILRLRTKKQEMMIAPAKQYVIIILQSPEDQP
jgi:dynein light chain roadblock-type